MSGMGNASDATQYQAAFREKVFILLLAGYKRIPNPENLQAAEEENITGLLKEQIEKHLDDNSSPNWVSRYFVQEEYRVHNAVLKGKHRKRLDFYFECSQQRPRSRYYFEAKRLSKGKYAVGKYTGPDGMGCFISGAYANKQKEAGMLGYIQTGTAKQWGDKVEKKVKGDEKLLHLKEWIKLTGKKQKSAWSISKHDRPSVGSPVVLYHLMLKFC